MPSIVVPVVVIIFISIIFLLVCFGVQRARDHSPSERIGYEPIQGDYNSWGEPHIDHDNGPHMQNNSMSVSMYHLPRICHTLIPEIRVRPEMLCVFRYIELLTCMIYNLTEPEQ